MDDTPSITIRLVTSAKEVAQEDWDRLANPQSDPSDTFDYNPFLSHAFFTAVEESGSACRETGWLPQHLVMEQAGEVTGIIPCYLKNHSQGEYVFDHGWADALERAGGAY